MDSFVLHQFGRCVALTLLFLGLSLPIVVGTDEVGSTWAMRAARLAVFAPVLTAVSGQLVVAHARGRGELRALEALGASPWRVTRGARLAGWCIGALAVLVVSGYADATSLFPAVESASQWSLVDGTLVDEAHGVEVTAGGTLRLSPISGGVAANEPSPLEWWAGMLVVLPLAVTLPPWMTTPSAWMLKAVVGVGAGMLLVVLLHGVAAGRMGASWLVLAVLPLALQTALGHVTWGSK